MHGTGHPKPTSRPLPLVCRRRNQRSRQAFGRPHTEPRTQGPAGNKSTGSCRRCDLQSEEEPYSCPPCRSDYRKMQSNRFPTFSNSRDTGKCCVCQAGEATVSAIQVGEGNNARCLICLTCARIACHHPLKHWRTDRNVRFSLCEGCGDHRDSLNAQGLCQGCGHKMSTLQDTLVALCDYLWLFLETAQGEPAPEPPTRIAKWLRPDSTIRRADAPANGRLNQQLSREICREYTTQQREIPELAIRFGVPPATIRSVLRGKTWAKQTQDTRPDVLRDEPHRTHRQVERPPTITVTRLKGEMGWTDELIKQHLGEEDIRLRNPHYSTSAPMRLFLLDRVATVTKATPVSSRNWQQIWTVGKRATLAARQRTRAAERPF